MVLDRTDCVIEVEVGVEVEVVQLLGRWDMFTLSHALEHSLDSLSPVGLGFVKFGRAGILQVVYVFHALSPLSGEESASRWRHRPISMLASAVRDTIHCHR